MYKKKLRYMQMEIFFQENQRDLMVSISSFDVKSYTSVFMYDKTVVAVVSDLYGHIFLRDFSS